jgi:NAD(P)-dependent dehydrogenase (short-subunit alcohol dehydrogenase family)
MTQDPAAAAPSLVERFERLSPASLFSLAGRTVLVTGASSGMGEAIALTTAAAGARVVAVARRRERLEKLADVHPSIVPVACDLAVKSELDALVERARALGRIDVLINTAAMNASVVPAEQETEDQVAQTLELNLVVPFRLAQAFGPAMREAGEGAIVNIASISGVVGVGRIPQASYVMSKSGLVGLTRELAAQWGRWGIRVNAIAAGYFKSDMTEAMFASPKMMDWLKPRQPLAFPGEPDDFAGTVLLLASRAGRFITGQTFAVDGGWTAI